MILTLGEILVEIMADAPGNGFREAIALRGPYPSGAPAIFISQAARMGAAAGIVSAVGADDFGAVNVERLRADGVDVSAVRVVEGRPTGSAFVRYRPDGARDFVFNIAHSANAEMGLGAAEAALVARARHLHLVGTSLVLAPVRAMAAEVARRVKAAGGTVSFDPNLRKEVLGAPGLMAAVEEVMGLTDLFLPSGEEIFLGTDAADPAEAATRHLARGARAVVWKRGAAGAAWFDARGRVDQAAFPVTEVDPTGAGDCFAGALVAAWTEGATPARALRLAAAAGALAVTKRGPMEGAGWRAEVEALTG